MLPSLLREPNKSFYGNRLYDLDPEVATDKILFTSPVLGSNPLYPQVIWEEDGIRVASLGRPHLYPEALSISEIVKALAQHYDFPTLFIDLTKDPIVAAFFATYRSSNGGYCVRQESGRVYRWPAVRISPARLWIPVGRETNQQRDRGIPAVDLSSVNKYFRRPYNQAAVLGVPVHDPWRIWSPSSVVTPPEELIVFDMAKLPCCESFELPSGAGEELTQVTEVTQDALFPNLIDLGYSYVSIIALLSLVIHRPSDDDVPLIGERTAAKLEDHFEGGIVAGRIVADRECFRLVPGCPRTEIQLYHTLYEAEQSIMFHAAAAREAGGYLDTEELKKSCEVMLSNQAAEVTKEVKHRFEAWNETEGKVLGPERQELMIHVSKDFREDENCL